MRKHCRPTRTRLAQRTPFPRPSGPLLRTALEALEARRVLSSPAGNQPPVVAAIADQLAAPGTQFAIQVVAQDAETPTERLTFSLAPGSSPHAQIDSSTGLLRFAAPASEGIESVTVVVTDDGSPQQSAIQRFDVVVSSVGFAGFADRPVGAVPPNLPPADAPSDSLLPLAASVGQAQAVPGPSPRILPAPNSALADTGVPHISESMEVASRGRVTVNRPEIPEPDASQPSEEPELGPPAAPENPTPQSPGSSSDGPVQDPAHRPAALVAPAGAVRAVSAPAMSAPVVAAPQAAVPGVGEQGDVPDVVARCATHDDIAANAAEAQLSARASGDAGGVPVGIALSARAAEGPRCIGVATALPHLDALALGQRNEGTASSWARRGEERLPSRPPEAVLQSALLLACALLRRGAVPLTPARGRRLGRFERLART